jgi:V/A-type H+-transporting ATPase subunit E
MAGAEALISRITKEAEEEVSRITKNAEEVAAKIAEKAKAQAKDMAAEILVKAEAKAEENKRRAFTMAELESRKELLNEKQIQIDSAFDGTVKKVAEIARDEYQAIVRKLILEAVETGDETVMVSPGDQQRLDEAFIGQVNDELEKMGKNGNLKIEVDTEDFGGGVILKSAQYKINNSFKSIIRMQRDELEAKVAEILFQ